MSSAFPTAATSMSRQAWALTAESVDDALDVFDQFLGGFSNWLRGGASQVHDDFNRRDGNGNNIGGEIYDGVEQTKHGDLGIKNASAELAEDAACAGHVGDTVNLVLR